MHTNCLLIDYENVQPKNLSLLSADHFRVVLFVGQSQHSVRTACIPGTSRFTPFHFAQNVLGEANRAPVSQ